LLPLLSAVGANLPRPASRWEAAAMVEHAHTISTAAAEIVALINSRAQSPWPHEIEAIIAKVAPTQASALHVSELGHKIRAAIARVDKAERSGEAAADAVASWGWDDLYRLEEQIPNPPQSFADLLIRAELAYFGADKEPDDRTMSALENGDCFGGPAARLIEVLQFAQCGVATDTSPLAGKIRNLMPQVQAAIIATTRTDAKAIGELGIDPDEYPEHVAAEKHVKALEDQLQALVDAAWAAPVRNFGDAVLLAEIAQHHAHDWPAIGEADGLTNPVCYDLEAFGRLTMAVLALAGRPFNAQPVAAPSEFGVRTRTGTVMVCDASRQRIQEIRDI
jgi:hypothetical protein